MSSFLSGCFVTLEELKVFYSSTIEILLELAIDFFFSFYQSHVFASRWGKILNTSATGWSWTLKTFVCVNVHRTRISATIKLHKATRSYKEFEKPRSLPLGAKLRIRKQTQGFREKNRTLTPHREPVPSSVVVR